MGSYFDLSSRGATACLRCATSNPGVQIPVTVSVNRKAPGKLDAPKLSKLAGRQGFEPRMTGPKPVVLPLHHRPIKGAGQ